MIGRVLLQNGGLGALTGGGGGANGGTAGSVSVSLPTFPPDEDEEDEEEEDTTNTQTKSSVNTIYIWHEKIHPHLEIKIYLLVDDMICMTFL